MLGFAILVAAIVATGAVVVRLMYRRYESEQPDGLELLAAGALIGLSLWIGVNWILAIASALTKRNLLIAAALFVCAGSTLFRPRMPRLAWRPWVVVGAAAVLLWTGFVLWRGDIVPPANHDALSYHLPKAVMIMRAEGHERFDWPDARLRNFPSNYELLLADVLILSGSDRRTEWIGTACYLAFLALTAVSTRRWWGSGLQVTASVLAVAGAPALLLHSGHDKNDLLATLFAAGALYWSAKWCARGGVVPAAFAIVCGAAAVGTKMTAASIAIGIAPFGIAALIRRPPRLRPLIAAVAFALVALLLCGGWVFVQNFGQGAADDAAVPAAYGDWRNLIDVPYLLVRASLGFNPHLPWRGEEWPWYPYSLYGSHYGQIFGVALLALPFCVWRFRRDGSPDAQRERAIATGAAILAFVVLLPLVQFPRSAAQATVRYALFLLPIVAGWTIAPLIRVLQHSRYAWTANAGVALIVAIFARHAAETAIFDTFAPIEHVRWCAAHPGTRRIHWIANRAESVVDAMAGAHDKIALHGGSSDIWVHPAYGVRLSRPVAFVREVEEIPEDARWVAIDYMPQRGRPSTEELRVYERLRQDRRFRLVYRHERFNQAVFVKAKSR